MTLRLVAGIVLHALAVQARRQKRRLGRGLVFGALMALPLLALFGGCRIYEVTLPPATHLGASPTWIDAGNTPTADRYAYASGTSGTYTVPAGYFVTSWWAHNTSGGGTVTVTPSGPRVYSPCDAGTDAADAGCQAAGTSIVIPAGAAGYGQAVPVLVGGYDELGDGTVFVFTSTDSYAVTLRRYSP